MHLLLQRLFGIKAFNKATYGLVICEKIKFLIIKLPGFVSFFFLYYVFLIRYIKEIWRRREAEEDLESIECRIVSKTQGTSGELTGIGILHQQELTDLENNR